MQPPYQLTPEILRLIARISETLGKIQALKLDRPAPRLRKENRIKTIQSSLGIEGNTLSVDQVTALLENKRVVAPKKDLLEVQNAIRVYAQLAFFDPHSISSFLNAHAMLMHQLTPDAGSLRSNEVGIMAGNSLAHMAPPATRVPQLMEDLFAYVKDSPELPLIKSCVFHYELEFIHPFSDGNGRMGRLWQTLLLMQEHPVFAFVPLETGIQQRQGDYYLALSQSDKAGNSTPFLAYMLEVILESLLELLAVQAPPPDTEARMRYFLESITAPFARKDYLRVFPNLSSATASRDLKWAVDQHWIEKKGDKAKTIYYNLNQT